MKLNLGCCDACLPGWVNVDRYLPADVITDLQQPWPWETSSVTEIRAWDIFEHLRSKVDAMNEAWRVLRPGGVLHLIVPTTDGRGAFQDPTHVSFWTPNDLFYYTHGDAHRERFGGHYGVSARFIVRRKEHNKYPDEVWKLNAVLEAVKP